jgi:hypothetical protein
MIAIRPMDHEKLSWVMHLTPAYQPEVERNVCHICLEQKKLSREHVPPRSAFNNCTALWDRLVPPKGANDAARQVMLKGGLYVPTLCQDCNNRVCSTYASAYVDFVRHLVSMPALFDSNGVARIVSVPCDTLMLAKELATMILAIEKVAYSKHYLALRQFVLNKDATLDPNFRVLAFLVPELPHAGTITRIHGRVDTFARGYNFVGGEISFFPFGFVYTSEIGIGYDLHTLTDVTHWFVRGNKADRLNTTVSLFQRLTGVDSIQCSVGHERMRPQIDYLA